MIFEHNVIIGTNLMSMGQAIGTADGYALLLECSFSPVIHINAAALIITFTMATTRTSLCGATIARS